MALVWALALACGALHAAPFDWNPGWDVLPDPVEGFLSAGAQRTYEMQCRLAISLASIRLRSICTDSAVNMPSKGKTIFHGCSSRFFL